MTPPPVSSKLPASGPAKSDGQPWKHRIGHLLWEVETRVSLLGEAGLGDTPLTLPALGLLDMVSLWPGSTVGELSRRTPKTQQAISQIVSRLEKLGYIERRLGGATELVSGRDRWIGVHKLPRLGQAPRGLRCRRSRFGRTPRPTALAPRE